MLQQLFGTQLDFPVRVAVALIVIAILLGVTIMLMRRFGGGMRSVATRGRAGPRLSLLESIAIDPRRKLMLVRCDDVEHLILVGGPTDIVVETDVNDRDSKRMPAPAMVAMPGAAPAAVPLQRPDLLAREAPAARLAPAPAVDALPPVEPRRPAAELAAPVAQDAPEAPAPQEPKRPLLGRRPLPRSDGAISGGAMSGRTTPAPTVTRGLVSRTAPPPAPAAETTVRPAAPAPAAPEPVVTPDLPPPVELAAPEAPAVAETPVAVNEERAEAVATSDSRIADMAERLDAALAQPAEDAPHLSLSDLLDDDLLAEVDQSEPAPPEAPPVRPTLKAPEPEKPAAAPEILSRRTRPLPVEPVARDASFGERSTVRPREARPVLSPPPQIERADRFTTAARREPPVRPDSSVRPEPTVRPEPAVRPEPRTGSPEFPSRPREFAFRPSEGTGRVTREAPRLEGTRRSFGGEESRAPSVSAPADEPAPRAPELARPSEALRGSESRLRDLPARDSEHRFTDGAPRAEPSFTARRWDAGAAETEMRPRAAPHAPPAPPLAEKPAAASTPADDDLLGDVDPLSDLDAEMANLLGRSSASGR